MSLDSMSLKNECDITADPTTATTSTEGYHNIDLDSYMQDEMPTTTHWFLRQQERHRYHRNNSLEE